MTDKIFVIALLLVTAAGAQEPAPPTTASTEVLWTDVREAAGITFVHHSAPEKKYIIESMSGGVALFDYNNDGLLDIYLVNSLTVETANSPETAPSALYKNLGDFRFEDVSKEAGVDMPGWGMGLCVADVDANGYLDLYITAVGRNVLYLNQGDGTFRDTAGQAGVEAGGWSAGCGFADYDRDGDLDLFVSRYVHFDLNELPEFGRGKTCQYRGISVQCGPRGLPGTTDLLFRNDKENDGVPVFTEVGKAAGVHDPDEFFGLGIAWVDVNSDGWLDLYVANDSNPSYLYMNQKDGTFLEDAFAMGVAVSEDGGEQGSMGVAVGDYKNEGRFSLFISNFSEEYNSFYGNEGEYFSDISFRSATAASSLPYVGWGTAFLDYDNDGWLDLAVVNGHVYPQLDFAKLGASAPYRQRRLLYHNKGDGTFDEVAERYGEVMTEKRVGRGLALGDLNNDGRLDLVVNDLDGPPMVLRHDRKDVGNWLQVQLEGAGKMKNGIGAVIEATAGKLKMRRLVRSGTSYLSQNDLRQHFGLGEATSVDLRVLWPDGTTTDEKGVPANQTIVIQQVVKKDS